MYNAIIIGAGPVGSYLANKLALLGHKVIVFDRKSSPGQKICCTGIISNECNDLLCLDKKSVLKQVNSARLFSPSKQLLRIWRNNDVACITDRRLLEQLLVTRARNNGAKFFFNARVSSIKYGNNCLLVKVDDSNGGKVFQTDAAVIATGFGSNLTANVGLGKSNQFIFGAQSEVLINNIDEVEIYFNQKISCGGFSWLVPTKEGKGLAGMITIEQPAFHLKQLLQYLKNEGKIISSESSIDYTAIPIRPLPKTYTDRILVVGEAAGQVKPITGGGIYYGILCADIAVDILDQAFRSSDLSAKKLSSYQKLWHKKLAHELTIGYGIQRLWGKITNNHIEYLFSIAQRRQLSSLLASGKKISFDWHSQTILQIAYSMLPFAKSRKQL